MRKDLITSSRDFSMCSASSCVSFLLSKHGMCTALMHALPRVVLIQAFNHWAVYKALEKAAQLRNGFFNCAASSQGAHTGCRTWLRHPGPHCEGGSAVRTSVVYAANKCTNLAKRFQSSYNVLKRLNVTHGNTIKQIAPP